MSKLEAIKTAVTSKTARQVLVARKYSPQVLFAAGVVGVVGATILACQATLKVQPIVEEHDRLVEKEKALHEKVNGTAYTDELLKKNLVRLNVQLALDLTKLYAPTAGVLLVSIASLTGSHVVLNKRNTGTMAAYAAVDKAYKNYRARVAAKYGEDVDREFTRDTEDVVVEEKLANGTTVTKTEKVTKPGIGGSGYAQEFDERSSKFTKEPGMNANIVMMCQNYAFDKLRANGHLFLNEVWDMLGLPRTKEGAVVGWIYKEGSDHAGDNYVTFNVFDNDSEKTEKFLMGREKYITIDPNVDGPIWDKI